MVPTLHEAREEDWPRFKALRLAALADTPDAFGSTLAGEQDQPEAWWRERILRPRVVHLVVRVDDRDAGLCVVAPTHEDATVAGLYAMWVAPWARGRGAGDALMRGAIDVGRRGGFRRMVLDVADDNAPAVALYARHGFEPTGVTGTLPPPRHAVTEHERALELGR